MSKKWTIVDFAKLIENSWGDDIDDTLNYAKIISIYYPTKDVQKRFLEEEPFFNRYTDVDSYLELAKAILEDEYLNLDELEEESLKAVINAQNEMLARTHFRQEGWFIEGNVAIGLDFTMSECFFTPIVYLPCTEARQKIICIEPVIPLTAQEKTELINYFFDCYYDTDQEIEDFGAEFYKVCECTYKGFIPFPDTYLCDYEEEMIEYFTLPNRNAVRRYIIQRQLEC